MDNLHTTAGRAAGGLGLTPGAVPAAEGAAGSGASAGALMLAGGPVPLVWGRHPRARRYVLRVQRDGVVRLTVPRRGSLQEGLDFARRRARWIRRQLEALATRPRVPATWPPGTSVWYRGAPVTLEVRVADGVAVCGFADCTVPVALGTTDLRPAVAAHLRALAAVELGARTWELARLHAVRVRRVSVRGQRSRWGSCSRSGTISLNWRLVQVPEAVRDYLIVHELMHLREMNHSARFWRHVAAACPEYAEAERWLSEHAWLLR